MSKTPFEMAIAVHEDRYGSLQTSASRWRLVALSLLGLLALCIGGMTTMALRSRVTPYVVQVDRHGYEVMIGPAEQASPADQRIVIADEVEHRGADHGVLADGDFGTAIGRPLTYQALRIDGRNLTTSAHRQPL